MNNVDYPWFARAKFSYHKPMITWIKAIPGVGWDLLRKAWCVPIEMVETVRSEAEKYGLAIQFSTRDGGDGASGTT